MVAGVLYIVHAHLLQWTEMAQHRLTTPKHVRDPPYLSERQLNTPVLDLLRQNLALNGAAIETISL